MALKGIMKALKSVIGDVGGYCDFIAYIAEEGKYIFISHLDYHSFDLEPSSSRIVVNEDVTFENTALTAVNITKLAIIEEIDQSTLNSIPDITETTLEIFPEKSVAIEVEAGQIVNFKGATLEIS